MATASADNPLGPLEIALKTGTEQFSTTGGPAAFDVLEFWRWSASDLVDNVRRGELAEFIVAKAFGVDVRRPREGWATWDLTWQIDHETSLAVEVKSAAYLQSWGQRALSKIQFVVPKRRGFDRISNALEATARRHADVYVFALLAHKDKLTVDPLRLNQWLFYVLPTHKLDERARSQHSITLKSLTELAGKSTTFEALARKVRQAGEEQRGRSLER